MEACEFDMTLLSLAAAGQVHIVTRDVLILSHRAEEKGQSVHGPNKSKVGTTGRLFV